MLPEIPDSMAASVTAKGQEWTLDGSIGFDNATQIYQQGLSCLKQQIQWPVYIDLAALQSSNSITLAVFVQWLRRCSDQKGSVQQALFLKNVPAKMQAIIQASSLAAEFGLKPSTD